MFFRHALRHKAVIEQYRSLKMEKQEAAGVLKNTRAGWRGAVDGDDNVIKTHSKIRTYMYVFPETWWNSDTGIVYCR